jgi:hypothetical protein
MCIHHISRGSALHGLLLTPPLLPPAVFADGTDTSAAVVQGQVVYERFYEQFTESEKAEVRGAFDGVAGPSSTAAAAGAVAEDAELVGRFRCVAGCHLPAYLAHIHPKPPVYENSKP